MNQLMFRGSVGGEDAHKFCTVGAYIRKTTISVPLWGVIVVVLRKWWDLNPRCLSTRLFSRQVQ